MAIGALAAWVVLSRLGSPLRDVQLVVSVVGTLTAVLALAASGLSAFEQTGKAGQAALVVLAVVSACTAVVAGRDVRTFTAALPIPLLATAAFAVSDGRLVHAQRPLVLAAVALVGMQVAALLPRTWRTGPVLGALVTTGAALASQVEAIAQAVVLPFGWLQAAWGLPAGRDAFPSRWRVSSSASR